MSIRNLVLALLFVLGLYFVLARVAAADGGIYAACESTVQALDSGALVDESTTEVSRFTFTTADDPNLIWRVGLCIGWVEGFSFGHLVRAIPWREGEVACPSGDTIKDIRAFVDLAPLFTNSASKEQYERALGFLCEE